MIESHQDLVDKNRVESAVKALLELIQTAQSPVSIIDTAKRIDIQFNVSKAATKRHMFPLNLPHSIDEDERDVCIFVKDLDLKDREYEKTVLHFQSLFTEKGITKISKIIPIKALRTDYSQPHDKRTLAKAYDLFLCDWKVGGLLPGLLGKNFYGKKKTVPRFVDFMASDLKQEMDRAIANSMCVISGKGASSSVQVGHSKMTVDKLVTNTMEAIRILAENVPGGRNNMQQLFIRTPEMTALPLYCNYVNPADIQLPSEKPKKLASHIDDVTTVEDGLVYVRADGYVKVVQNKRKLDEKITDEIDEKKPKLEIKDEYDNVDGGKVKTRNSKQSQKKSRSNMKSQLKMKNDSKHLEKGKKQKSSGGEKPKHGSLDDEIKNEDVSKIEEIKIEEEDGESKESIQRKRKTKKRDKELDATKDKKGDKSCPVVVKKEFKKEINKRQSTKQNILKKNRRSSDDIAMVEHGTVRTIQKKKRPKMNSLKGHVKGSSTNSKNFKRRAR